MHRLLGKRDPDDPYVPPQNPFEVFLLAISLVAALPLLEGDTGSAVLEEYLADGTVALWGAALMTGSTMALGGLYAPYRFAFMGLHLERGGLILSGGAAAIYAWVVVAQAGYVGEVRYITSMQMGYTAACAWRAWQLTRAIRWSSKNSTVGRRRAGE